MMTENRIFFKDNPFPNGHRIKDFLWSGRLDPEKGIWFDFHLETENYYAEDGSDDAQEPESDWQAKIVWGNYHRCTMSSSQWHTGGILVGTEHHKLDCDQLLSQKIIADPLPLDENWEDDDLAFHIYLLGHDSCAGHEITFAGRDGVDQFDINWKGKIALTYSGYYDFEHEFEANLSGVKFDGIELPDEVSVEKTRLLLEKFVVNSGSFEIKNKTAILKS